MFPKLEVAPSAHMSAQKCGSNIKPKSFNPNPHMVAKLITEFKFPMKNGIAPASKISEQPKTTTIN